MTGNEFLARLVTLMILHNKARYQYVPGVRELNRVLRTVIRYKSDITEVMGA